MKIRTTLTLKYTGVTATVFLICMILIYWVSERTRSNTFFHDLKSEAITKAHLFLNNRADAATMQSIYTNNKQFINEVEVAVYTTDFRMLYHDAIQNDIVKENREMIRQILQKKEIELHIGKYQGIKMQEIRLDELLLDARSVILRAHPSYKVELIFEQESDDDRLITVRGNLYLLTIAFSNLIENNCKYAANQSSVVQISFWKEWAVIRLSDNGVGMSETEKQHLFTLFYRGEKEHTTEGHGIGMALAQKIIHLHDGRINVHSAEGKGTTFIVELPHV